MASTRKTLEDVSRNVDESMGRRRHDRMAQLSPVPSVKDEGRRPLRTFGAVEVDRIVPDPNQPRSDFDAEEIQRLAGSIRAQGQLHPIRVRWSDDVGKWVIVSGERRWRAARAAGVPTVDCCFVDSELTAAELQEQQLVENLLRSDLKPLEEARAYQSLMELNGWNGKQVAAALHVTTSRVSRALSLLDLPKDVQQKIEAGTLPKTSAYEISKLDDTDQQTRLAQQAASGTFSHARTVKQIRQRRGKKSARQRTGLHQVFISQSGLKVTVTASSRSNYYEVEQALSEALDEVRHRIGNNVQLL